MRAARLESVLRERQLPALLLLAPLFLVGRPLLNLAGIAAAAGWLGLRRVLGGPLFPASVGGPPLVGLLVMTGAGLLVSLAPGLSVVPALDIWYGVILLYSVLTSVRDLAALRAVLGCFVLLSAALLPAVLLGTDWTDKTLTFLPRAIYAPLPRLFGFLAAGSAGTARSGFNPNEVALVLGMALAVLTGLALLPRPALARCAGAGAWRAILRRPVLWSLALLCLGVIVLTQSRGTLLALVPAAIVLALTRWSALRRRRTVAGIAAGVLLAGALLLVLAGPQWQARLLDPSGQGLGSGSRFIVWQRALLMIADFPLTGIGLNDFPIMQPILYPAYELHDTSWVHAHNLYLQTALDLGLPGLACLCWLLAVLARPLPALYRQAGDALFAGLAGALAAAVGVWLVNGWVDAPMRLGTKAGIALWLLFGLLATVPVVARASGTTGRSDPGPPSPSAPPPEAAAHLG